MKKPNDVYYVRDKGAEGEWYIVVLVYKGHMELLPGLHSEKQAKELARRYLCTA